MPQSMRSHPTTPTVVETRSRPRPARDGPADDGDDDRWSIASCASSSDDEDNPVVSTPIKFSETKRAIEQALAKRILADKAMQVALRMNNDAPTYVPSPASSTRRADRPYSDNWNDRTGPRAGVPLSNGSASGASSSSNSGNNSVSTTPAVVGRFLRSAAVAVDESPASAPATPVAGARPRPLSLSSARRSTNVRTAAALGPEPSPTVVAAPARSLRPTALPDRRGTGGSGGAAPVSLLQNTAPSPVVSVAQYTSDPMTPAASGASRRPRALPLKRISNTNDTPTDFDASGDISLLRRGPIPDDLLSVRSAGSFDSTRSPSLKGGLRRSSMRRQIMMRVRFEGVPDSPERPRKSMPSPTDEHGGTTPKADRDRTPASDTALQVHQTVLQGLEAMAAVVAEATVMSVVTSGMAFQADAGAFGAMSPTDGTHHGLSTSMDSASSGSFDAIVTPHVPNAKNTNAPTPNPLFAGSYDSHLSVSLSSAEDPVDRVSSDTDSDAPSPSPDTAAPGEVFTLGSSDDHLSGLGPLAALPQPQPPTVLVPGMYVFVRNRRFVLAHESDSRPRYLVATVIAPPMTGDADRRTRLLWLKETHMGSETYVSSNVQFTEIAELIRPLPGMMLPDATSNSWRRVPLPGDPPHLAPLVFPGDEAAVAAAAEFKAASPQRAGAGSTVVPSRGDFVFKPNSKYLPGAPETDAVPQFIVGRVVLIEPHSQMIRMHVLREHLDSRTQYVRYFSVTSKMADERVTDLHPLACMTPNTNKNVWQLSSGVPNCVDLFDMSRQLTLTPMSEHSSRAPSPVPSSVTPASASSGSSASSPVPNATTPRAAHQMLTISASSPSTSPFPSPVLSPATSPTVPNTFHLASPSQPGHTGIARTSSARIAVPSSTPKLQHHSLSVSSLPSSTASTPIDIPRQRARSPKSRVRSESMERRARSQSPGGQLRSRPAHSRRASSPPPNISVPQNTYEQQLLNSLQSLQPTPVTQSSVLLSRSPSPVFEEPARPAPSPRTSFTSTSSADHGPARSRGSSPEPDGRHDANRAALPRRTPPVTPGSTSTPGGTSSGRPPASKRPSPSMPHVSPQSRARHDAEMAAGGSGSQALRNSTRTPHFDSPPMPTGSGSQILRSSSGRSQHFTGSPPMSTTASGSQILRTSSGRSQHLHDSSGRALQDVPAQSRISMPASRTHPDAEKCTIM